MPHQCLKCGKVFPSGSSEILKGCSDCGGKKFFYTEQPVSEEERKRLTEQANKDIKVLIREILSQHEPLKTYDSEGRAVDVEAEAVAVSGAEVSGKIASDWVKVSPGKGKEGDLEAEVEKVKAPSVSTSTSVPAPKHPTVKEILEELRRKSKLKEEEMAKGERLEQPPAMTRPPKTKRETGSAKIKRKRIPKHVKRKGYYPEVITVREPGVYNISLNKLLKCFPIIINRDGTYLVHLPSVFESFAKEKGKK